MRIEDISYNWTAEERLRLIALISAYMRARSMGTIPNDGPVPNAETIMVIATSSAEFLNSQRGSFPPVLDAIRAYGIRPMTGDECVAQFEQMKGAEFDRWINSL